MFFSEVECTYDPAKRYGNDYVRLVLTENLTPVFKIGAVYKHIYYKKRSFKLRLLS